MAGLRRIAAESFPKDPAEAVSHAEQRPCYSPVAAGGGRGPGRHGGRKQSLQAACPAFSPPAARAVGKQTLPLWFELDGLLGFGLCFFLKEVISF